MKCIKSDLRSIIFIMGFFNNFLNKKQNSYFKNYILLKFLKIFDTFVFLGKKEYEYAKLNFPHASHKFIYIPFSIDVEFWKNENHDSNNRQSILFIGNDQNRDFELLRKIANSLPEENFLFVTNSEFQNLPSNVRTLKGSWRTELISDSEIKNLYMNSWLSIIPLKESLQPSGQSVALQSMSMHIPVMISLTKGFWDHDLFEDEKNIYFIKNGIEEWVSKIESLHKNNNLKLILKSHLWPKLVKPTKWSNNKSWYPEDESFMELPSEKEFKENIFVPDLEFGDAVLFNFKIVHGSDANLTTSQRRAFSMRFIGDDVKFLKKNGPTSPPFDGINLESGNRMRTDWFPEIFNN